jgi:hypothetical protein
VEGGGGEGGRGAHSQRHPPEEELPGQGRGQEAAQLLSMLCRGREKGEKEGGEQEE